MGHLAANTLAALRPGLVEFYVCENARLKQLHPLGPKGFQIIGLDVLFTESLEPILIELNANPSLSVMQPVHEVPESAEETDLATIASVNPAGASSTQARGASPGPAKGRSSGCRSNRSQTRARLGLAGQAREKSIDGTEKKKVVSELDLEIKRELVCQALLLANPAPQSKVARLRQRWLREEQPLLEIVPLDDTAQCVPFGRKRSPAEAIRPDAAVDKCPALEILDFEALVAPDVTQYARAHLTLYRCWCRNCGQNQDTLGQAQMLRLIERGGLTAPGSLWPDKVAAQLWLTRVWRGLSEGAFGLNLTQFVVMAGWIGQMLAGEIAPHATELELENGPSRISGVLEFVSHGLCGME